MYINSPSTSWFKKLLFQIFTHVKNPGNQAGLEKAFTKKQDMPGLLLYILYIVTGDTTFSPSCTVRCPGAPDSLVLLSSYTP